MSDNTLTDQAVPQVEEAISLMSLTTVGTVLYTFSFVLYCFCARLSYYQLRGADRKGRTVLTFTLASFMITCATLNVALNNQYARITFVDYGSLPGGPVGTLAQAHAARTIQIDDILNLIAQSLALGTLQLWRVWVVYSGSRLAIPIFILASLFYLAHVVSYVLRVAFIWAPLASTFSDITRTMDIVVKTSFSLSTASAITMALMIAIRLILVRQKHIKLMGKTDIAAQYLGIAAMLIESYALSTVWNIGDLIAYILKNPPTHDFFGPTVQQAGFLSYFLVWYRVFAGRAWDRQTQTELSTMRWEHGGNQTTHTISEASVMGAADMRGSHVAVNSPTFPSRPDV